MKIHEHCGCFPTGKHYPGIAHLIKVRAIGVASEFDPSAAWIDMPIALIDLETTGRSALTDRIVEVGIVIGQSGHVVARHNWLINPGIAIPAEAMAVHGIKDEDVADKPPFRDTVVEIVKVLESAIPAAYNASFDRGFLLAEMDRAELRLDNAPPALRREVSWLDPLVFARELYKQEESRALSDMTKRLGIALERAHRATDDAEAALMVLYAFAKDGRVPRSYGALVQEQRRLHLAQEDARRMWRKG